jgi:hypothetical protein
MRRMATGGCHRFFHLRVPLAAMQRRFCHSTIGWRDVGVTARRVINWQDGLRNRLVYLDILAKRSSSLHVKDHIPLLVFLNGQLVDATRAYDSQLRAAFTIVRDIPCVDADGTVLLRVNIPWHPDYPEWV